MILGVDAIVSWPGPGTQLGYFNRDTLGILNCSSSFRKMRFKNLLEDQSWLKDKDSGVKVFLVCEGASIKVPMSLFL